MRVHEVDRVYQTKSSHMLTRILFATIVALSLSLLISLLNRPQDIIRAVALSGILASAVIALWTQQQDRPALAGGILLVGAWLGIVIPSIFLGGLETVALLLLSVVILFGGLMYGQRIGVALTVLSVVAVVALYVLGEQGLIAAVQPPLTQIHYLATYVIAFVLTTLGVDLARSRLVAVLELATRRSDDFSGANEELQQEALERQNAVEAERRQRRIAESLRAVTLALASTLQRQEVLELILDSLTRFVQYDSVSLVLLTEDGIELAAHRGPNDTDKVGRRWQQPLALQSLVMDTQRPQYLADTETDERWSKLPTGKRVSCWLGIPLIAHERTIGLMSLTESTPEAYSDEDISVAGAFAAQAAVAIENARLYEESQRQTRQLATLYEATLATTQVLDVQELLALLHGQAAGLIAFSRYVVVFYDETETDVYLPFVVDDDVVFESPGGAQHMDEHTDLTTWVLTRGRTLMVSDVCDPNDAAISRVQTDLGADLKPDKHRISANDQLRALRSWLGIPLLSRGQVIGAVILQARDPGSFTVEDRRVMEALTRQSAVALRNARLYDLAQQEIRERTLVEAQLEVERSTLAERVEERTRELQRQYQWQIALGTLEPIINNPRMLRSVLDKICTLADREFQIDGGVKIIVTGDVPGISGDRVGGYSIAAQSSSLVGNSLDVWHSEPRTAEIIRTQQMEVIDDILSRDTQGSQLTEDFGLRSLIGVPLLWQNDCLGVLYILGRRPFAPSVEQLAYLRSLANRAAVAIMNVSLFQTMQQANREYARVLELKDDFMASMSHELRTPLNAILGLTESLDGGVYGPVTDRQQRALDNIQKSGLHLLSLITDILDLSKIEAGEMVLEMSGVSVHEICQTSLDFVRQMADKKQLYILYQHDDQISRVHGDERRLTQIIVNLLSNAVKFTPAEGEIGLTVSGDESAGEVLFVVWDTGIGIEEEHLPRLFDPFIQIDSRLTRQYEGTGLGLSLVKRMAELHGGYIDVTSTPGEGSRFTVHLPWKRDDANKPRQIDDACKQANAGGQ